MDITPKRTRGGPSVLNGQDRTCAYYINQVRYTSDTDTDDDMYAGLKVRVCIYE
jgi:hypothetical protein